MAEKEIFEEIMKRADALAPELVKLRRDFHKYPELGWMEMRTTSIVASCLKESGCDQVLVGKEVCKAEARMGVPSEALLEDHYEEVKEQEVPVIPEKEETVHSNPVEVATAVEESPSVEDSKQLAEDRAIDRRCKGGLQPRD